MQRALAQQNGRKHAPILPEPLSPMSEQQTAIPPDRGLTAAPDTSDTNHMANAPPGAASDSATHASKLLEALKWAVSFPAMLGAMLVGLVFYHGRTFPVDPDLWWHIKVGQDIFRTHHLPTSDPYSFTVFGTPWIAWDWLSDVAIGLVGKFGLQALDAFLILFGSAIMLALYYYAFLRSGNSKAAFVAVASLSTFAFGNFNLRPQMFGYLCLVITLIALERFRQGHPRFLWLLPPVCLVWINAHGSWLIGPCVILLVLVCGLFEFRMNSVEVVRWTPKQRLQLELAFLGSLLVIPITPYGTQLAIRPFLAASAIPIGVQTVMEWKPMPFEIAGGKLFLAILVGVFVLHTLYRFTFRLHEWILALGGIVMACLHVRFVLLFVPFFAPLFATMLARWIPAYNRPKDKFALNAVLMAGVALAMLWRFPTLPDLQEKVQRTFPSRAVAYLRTHPFRGPLFNTYAYGGYLVAFLPEHKVFIDGREDIYEFQGVMGDYIQATDLKPAAFWVLKSYDIRTCMLYRAEPLAIVLDNHPAWQRVYSDDSSIILVRKDSLDGTAAFLAAK